MPDNHRIYIGTAGWQIPKSLKAQFPEEGTHLHRYAQVLDACEVNTSFYKEHRARTWRKWSRETPEGFRFAVKAPRRLTHQQELTGTNGLDDFLEEISELEEKLGPILLQLPPRLKLDRDRMRPFFEELRQKHDGPIVCEPRHESWLEDEGEEFLNDFRIARVAVDPGRHLGDSGPGGWPGLRYVRLHGYPRRFYSAYEEPFLRELKEWLEDMAKEAETWCVFNNTALDGGTENALYMTHCLWK